MFSEQICVCIVLIYLLIVILVFLRLETIESLQKTERLKTVCDFLERLSKNGSRR